MNESSHTDAAIAGGIAAAAIVAENKWLPKQVGDQDRAVIAFSTLLACFGAWSARHDKKGASVVAMFIIAGIAGLGARAATVIDDLRVASAVRRMVAEYKAGDRDG